MNATAAAMEIDDINRAETELFALMEQLRELPEVERHGTLSEWARSEFYHPGLMLALGWHGALAREAYKALEKDLSPETPGKRWDALPYPTARASIIRLLGLEDHPARHYAALPFRAWEDDDGRNWIAGAIGCAPVGTPDRFRRWRHLDIRDVILWDPRTNDARIAGEHAGTATFVIPDMPTPRLKVWGDCGAYFRAWAHDRARTGLLLQRRGAGEWAHPILEPDDSGLPGALLVGDFNRAHWPAPHCSSVIAMDGISPGEIHFSVARAAGIPIFEGV